MIRLLGETDLAARAWSGAGTPGPVFIRLGPLSFVLDKSDAHELSDQLVEALSQLKAEQ